MSFPTSPDALTCDWLSEALGRPITGFRVERFAAGVGVIGQVVRVHIDEAGGARSSLIAKFAATNPDTRALAASFDMYGREHRFYSHLSKQVPLRVPACYRSEFRQSDQGFVLLLEDLAGWRMGDQVTGTSIADARVLVASLARMQAQFWDVQPGAMGVEWVPVHNNPAQIAGMQAGFNNGWPVVCARMPELIPANAMRVAERIAPAVPLLLARMCVAPLTLTHSDVRLDNVFFGADEIALVDWQSVCLSAPEHDLAYFITQSLSHESRRAHGLELVRLYVDELQRNGVSGYTFDECFQRYRYAALYLACFAVTIAGTLDMGNERGDQLARALLGRSLQAIDELDGYALLG